MIATSSIPPIADGWPLIGSLLPMATDFEGFLYKQYAKHGSCFRIKIFNEEFIVIGGSDAAEVLAKNSGQVDAWKVWEDIIGEFGGRQVLTMLEGEEHLKYRAAARKGFAKARVQENIPLVSSLLQEALQEHPVGQPFYVSSFAQRLVANCIGSLTLGRKPGKYLEDFITYWHTQLAVNLVGSKQPSALRKQEYLQARDNARTVADEILNSDEGTIPSPYVQDLKKLMEEDPNLINHEELRFMMLLPYVAGLDTVVNVLILSMYEIHRRPELLAQLKEEVKPFVEEGLPAQKMRQMKVLHATVMEVMRYYPIANMFNRYATIDFEFKGYQIHKGQKLMMALMASHRDPASFANPDQFEVERFLEPRNEHRQKQVFNPYGAGAHTCLGAGMAEVLLAVLISTIVDKGNLALFPEHYKMKPFHANKLNPDPKLQFVRQA